MSSKELEFVIANLVQKVDLLGQEVKDLRARLENVEVQVSDIEVKGGQEKQVHQPRTGPVIEVGKPAMAHNRMDFANLGRELESTGTGVPESFSASKPQCKMGEDVVDDSVVAAFDELSLKPMLLRGIYGYGYEKPSDIQQRALIPLISGRDVILQTLNGADRTVTYSIAILQQINPENPNYQALVLAPTRELAQQILKLVLALGEYMGVTCHACIGGTNVRDDKQKLETGAQIVVGTPGRVFDMINRRSFRTEMIMTLVLDDIDEKFSHRFKNQVLKVHKKMNRGTQMISLASTMSISCKALDSITELMFDPVFISTKDRELELTLARIKQFYMNVEKEEWKLDALLDIFDTLEVSRAVVICNTRRNVNLVTQKMRGGRLTVSAAYENMGALERDVFRSSRVMITTESLSRVIDAEEVFFVVNYDLPKCPENYYYRICLCGHPGRKGVVINFVTDEEQRTLKSIENFYNTQIMEIRPDAAVTA